MKWRPQGLILIKPFVRKVTLSWIVIYPNIWDKTSGQPWETSFASVPKTSPLIDQRCRLSIINKCVSLSHTVCGCRPTLSSAPTYTRTHTLALSLSVCSLSVSYKNPFPRLFDIIEIQDFAVFGCSHFIGSTNTKLLPWFLIQWYFKLLFKALQ
jgi:hypothetical protein